MRASHLTWLVASLVVLSGCGSRSPYEDDDEYCAVPASGGSFVGSGGYALRGGATGKGGTTAMGGTTVSGGRGGYGGIGGYAGFNLGGRGGSGGISYGGGFAGAPRGGAGGVGAIAGKGGIAGNAGRGGVAGNAGRGGAGGVGAAAGFGGSAGANPGGAAGRTLWAGGPSSGGTGGYAGNVGLGAVGTITGGTANAGGTATAGTANSGMAGATAGTSPGGAGPWTGCTCNQTGCGTCPTTTVTVDRGSYYVDATETTNADYALFLAANVPISAQPSVCVDNTTYVPNGTWPLIGRDNYPVAYVDWCDAYAYCAWAGKRLCGAIGGGANPYGDLDDFTKDEWFAACTSNGTNIYPYGSTYNSTACNGLDNAQEATVPVGSMPLCKAAAGDIYDMSGNLFEWVDSCDNWTGQLDTCYTRGGSYFSDELVMRCRTASTQNRRNSVRPSVGIRCCANK